MRCDLGLQPCFGGQVERRLEMVHQAGMAERRSLPLQREAPTQPVEREEHRQERAPAERRQADAVPGQAGGLGRPLRRTPGARLAGAARERGSRSLGHESACVNPWRQDG